MIEEEIIYLGEEVKKFVNSPVGRYFLNYAEKQEQDALFALSTVDPHNIQEIMKLQNEVRRNADIKGWINEAIHASDIAYQHYIDNEVD